MTASHTLPLVSVVVPVYNVEPYLRRCLDSIIAQSYPHWELLLINDGSTDASPSICAEYQAMEPRIRFMSQANQGLSATRNRGVREARGELIAFIDSDDSIAPDTLEGVVETLALHPECDQIQFPSHQGIGSGRDYMTCIEHAPISERSQLLKCWMRDRIISWIACDRMYRRTLLEDIEFKVGYYYEDALFSCMVALRSRGICFSTKGMYHYYTNAGSITQSYSPKKGQDKIDIHVEMSKLLLSSREHRVDAAFALYIVVNDMWASYMYHKRNNDVTDRGIDLLREVSWGDFLFVSELPLRRRGKMLITKLWSHIARRYQGRE